MIRKTSKNDENYSKNLSFFRFISLYWARTSVRLAVARYLSAAINRLVIYRPRHNLAFLPPDTVSSQARFPLKSEGHFELCKGKQKYHPFGWYFCLALPTGLEPVTL